MLKFVKKLPKPLYAGVVGFGIGVALGISTGVAGLGGAVNGAIVFGPLGFVFGVLSFYANRGRKK